MWMVPSSCMLSRTRPMAELLVELMPVMDTGLGLGIISHFRWRAMAKLMMLNADPLSRKSAAWCVGDWKPRRGGCRNLQGIKAKWELAVDSGRLSSMASGALIDVVEATDELEVTAVGVVLVSGLGVEWADMMAALMIAVMLSLLMSDVHGSIVGGLCKKRSRGASLGDGCCLVGS